MLVLSRSLNESITIGSKLLVKVMRFHDTAVDLAFARRSIDTGLSPRLAARMAGPAARISVENRTMKLDDVFEFDPGVKIMVVDLRGPNLPDVDPIHWKVRLGIKAPRDLQVHRKEIYGSIPREYRLDEPWPAEWE
jgi:sRNA-binding carbon storage regulator CsrA